MRLISAGFPTTAISVAGFPTTDTSRIRQTYVSGFSSADERRHFFIAAWQYLRAAVGIAHFLMNKPEEVTPAVHLSERKVVTIQELSGYIHRAFRNWRS